MKADILTLKTLFQKDVRYVIPTFQRPYVWNQEDQWEPLWNDVRNVAEQYLEELAVLGEGSEAVAEERAGRHFLGAVVLQQQATSASELETRHVIDGQQRLTTLQLMLDAAQEVFEHDGFPKEARQLRRLVLNDPDYAEGNHDRLFKVWPTLGDREPFRRAMSNELVVDGYEDVPIVQAHDFFKLQTREWLGEHPESASARAHALATALMGLLQMVVIDLSTIDDANVIFETLNARGTPLLASDLIKNAVLHAAGQSGLNADQLYQQHWQAFDQEWWRAEVRQGRLVRPRIDVYLNYWLTMRTAEEVQSAYVFPRFQNYALQGSDPPALTAVVTDIQATGGVYRELETKADASAEGLFLYRWHVMDAGVSTPVVLWLFSHRTEIGTSGFLGSLAAIESYFVRRMVCRMTTKDYNKLFLELIAQLKDRDPAAVSDVISGFLREQTADSRLWPTDSQLRDAFLTLPLYQLLTRGRLRMVLEGLEDSLRSPKSEGPVTKGGLTIEHVMPQAWRDYWPLAADAGATAAEVRDRLVQTIGNLTLVTARLNPALSNSAWADPAEACKRKGLADHSVLQLNRKLLEAAPTTWDEASIQARGAELARLAATVWPR
ncbi:MAG: DUF262 domain-containing protein [Chloroflexi bacterium]|nr:DUF262 domain-containing protein [Chloroflexota bacterium]